MVELSDEVDRPFPDALLLLVNLSDIDKFVDIETISDGLIDEFTSPSVTFGLVMIIEIKNKTNLLNGGCFYFRHWLGFDNGLFDFFVIVVVIFFVLIFMLKLFVNKRKKRIIIIYNSCV